MANLYLVSENEDFKNDLIMQIGKFVPELIISDENPDIILLDENLKLYKQFRAQYPSVPMVLLSAEKRVSEDKLNIVLLKPFVLNELFDVLRAANNKLDNSREGYLNFGDFELHPNAREIVSLSENNCIKLTEKEVGIIKYLHKNSDKFVSKTALQKNVWKYNEDATTHTIETHIYRLRQKVEKHTTKRLILTENGCYKLNTD